MIDKTPELIEKHVVSVRAIIHQIEDDLGIMESVDVNLKLVAAIEQLHRMKKDHKTKTA